jgi:murein DD-endopeptidase MepM/ murein hydrolase activator NlpD
MTESKRSQRGHDLRTFGAGAGCGLLGGMFLMATIVWQFGNVIGTRASRDLHPADPPKAIARWEDGTDDLGSAVLDAAADQPRGTTGALADAPPSGAAATIGPTASSAGELNARELGMPVEGIVPDQLTRQFDQPRGGARKHEALDILAPRGTPVKAVEDGRIARLFHSNAGGITIYQFDPSERYCYYYAHLERYAAGLSEGDQVRRGQVIGYVGTSGNAPKDTPHLHFAIFRLTADKRWWEGTPIDPYDVLR